MMRNEIQVKKLFNQAGYLPVLAVLAFALIVVSVGGIYYAKNHEKAEAPLVVEHKPSTSYEATHEEGRVQAPDAPAVAGISTPAPTPEIKIITETPKVDPSQVRTAVAEEIKALLAQGLLQGPKGEKGDKGEPPSTGFPGSVGDPGISLQQPANNLGQVLGISTPSFPFIPPGPQGPTVVNTPSIQSVYIPAGLVPPNNQGFNGAVLGGFDSLGVKNLTSDKTTLTGTTTVSGNLTVSGAASFANLTPQTAGTGQNAITTQNVAVSDYLFEDWDSQKWMVLGSDGFARFLHMDDDPAYGLIMVQCTNNDCTAKVSTVIATNINGFDNPTMVMGQDGLPRIAYITYDSPNQIYFVQCLNDSCSSKVNTLVDTGTSIGLSGFYGTSIAIGADGFARIVYDNYTPTSAVRFAQCTNASCSTKVLTTVATPGNYPEMSTVAMAPDGFARIVYPESGTNPDELHLIQCTNAACTTRVDTVVDTAATGPTSYYWTDLVVGSDGFSRITYTGYGSTGNGLYLILCGNAACSTKTNTSVGEYGGYVSLVLDSAGIAHIANSSYGRSSYTRCLDLNCTLRNSTKINNAGYSPISLALGSDGYPRIIFYDSQTGYFSFKRFTGTDGSNAISGTVLGSLSIPYSEVNSVRLTAQEILSSGSSSHALWVKNSAGATIFNVNAELGGVDAFTAIDKVTIQSDPGNTSLSFPGQLIPALVVNVGQVVGARPLFFGHSDGSSWTSFITAGACGSFAQMCLDLGTGSTLRTALENVGTTMYIAGGDDGTFTDVLFKNTGSISINTATVDSTVKLFVSGSQRIDGGLCIRNATACPTYAAGRLYVDTAGTVGGDDPGDVFDIAEMYAADSVSPGDVIIADSATGKVKKTTEFGELDLPSITKSKKAYDNVLGVVSARPAIAIAGHFVITGPDKQKENADLAQVALVGRVHVKVSTENGEIKIGDYLTSSELFPGYAMRATRSGEVIGQSLEDYSSNEAGKVLVFLKPAYQVINSTFILESEDGQLTSQIFKIEANTQSTALLVNQNGSGDLLQIQSNGANRFVVDNAGNLAIQADNKCEAVKRNEIFAPRGVELYNPCTDVLSVKNGDKEAFKITPFGDVAFSGRVLVSKDTAGLATVKIGEYTTKIKFEYPYPSPPIITLTSVGVPSFTYGVTDITGEGFNISTSIVLEADTQFFWHAFFQPDGGQVLGVSAIAPIITPAPTPQPNPAPTPNPAPNPSPEKKPEPKVETKLDSKITEPPKEIPKTAPEETLTEPEIKELSASAITKPPAISVIAPGITTKEITETTTKPETTSPVPAPKTGNEPTPPLPAE